MARRKNKIVETENEVVEETSNGLTNENNEVVVEETLPLLSFAKEMKTEEVEPTVEEPVVFENEPTLDEKDGGDEISILDHK